MKILKVFGIVVGIHVFALILIFANPGCSAMTKSTPAPADTAAKPDSYSPNISVPTIAATDSSSGFDPHAPAISYPAGVRYSPTRPNTPAAGALEAEAVSDVTPATTYTVAKGDSLWSVARKNHLTKAELAAANNLRPEATLRVGQKLIIPIKAVPGMAGIRSAPPAPGNSGVDPASAQKGPADSVKHVVRAGETLGAIARKYQVKVGEIATANNISDPAKIHPGMELIIPGWQAPGGKAAKAPAKGSTRPAAESASADAIPIISVGAEDQQPSSTVRSADEPPVIPVEDAPPPPKKP